MIRVQDTPRRLRLDAGGMTAPAILQEISRLVGACRGRGEPRTEVVVDVTDAWSIPWTTQPVPLAPERRGQPPLFVRHKGFRWAADRTEAVYEIAS